MEVKEFFKSPEPENDSEMVLDLFRRGVGEVQDQHIESARHIAQEIFKMRLNSTKYRSLKQRFFNLYGVPVDNYISNIITNSQQIVDEFLLEYSLDELSEIKLNEEE